MTPPSDKSRSDPRAALARHFGFPDFRGPQEEIIRHVLGGQDALVNGAEALSAWRGDEEGGGVRRQVARGIMV